MKNEEEIKSKINEIFDAMLAKGAPSSATEAKILRMRRLYDFSIVLSDKANDGDTEGLARKMIEFAEAEEEIRFKKFRPGGMVSPSSNARPIDGGEYVIINEN